MAKPTPTFEIAFASQPFDSSQTYTDVTASLRHFSCSYGRQTEQEAPGTGEAQALLFARDRRFEPEYSGGTYYPNVVPERRMRMTMTLSGTVHRVFTGFIDGWPQPYDNQPRVELPLAATDGFEVLAQAQLTTGATYAQATSGTRVGAILDSVGWPSAERSLDTGQSQIVAVATGGLDGSYALNHIQDVATTETGFAFVAPDGSFTFHDRHRRLKAPYNVSQATFSDGTAFSSGTFHYHQLTVEYSRGQVQNDFRVTPSGGTTYQAEDSTSIAAYRRRSRSVSTLHASATEAQAQANFLVSRYKDPLLTFRELTIRPGNDTNLWDQVLTRALGDRVTVVRTPPGGGTAITKQVVIEQIRHDFPADLTQAVTTWRLSPAALTDYWVVSVSSVGTTTRVAY